MNALEPVNLNFLEDWRVNSGQAWEEENVEGKGTEIYLYPRPIKLLSSPHAPFYPLFLSLVQNEHNMDQIHPWGPLYSEGTALGPDADWRLMGEVKTITLQKLETNPSLEPRGRVNNKQT